MEPLVLGGRPRTTDLGIEVVDKFDGTRIATVAAADPALVREAIASAHGARDAMRALAPAQRADILERVAARLEEQREGIADTLVREAGKPIRFALAEVDRALDTFRIAAREAVRIEGGVVPLDGAPANAGYRATWKRVPVGVCGFIAPFNFPLNLVAHKVAPAIAAGCPFVLKPASVAPLGALRIADALAAEVGVRGGLPEGSFSVLPARGAAAEPIATDDRVAKLSFTGSDEVGWRLAGLAAKKRVTLELGGNAAVVVDETADLDDAVRRIVFGAYYQAGQSCISVQRIVAVEALLDELRDRLVAAVEGVVAGDPRSADTLVGPLIAEDEADRVLRSIDAARAAGAEVLVGGGRSGPVVEATLVEGVPHGQDLLDEEVFGPVAVLIGVPDYDAALAEVNRSRFGLQAGVFTRDVHRAHRAWDELEVGGVVVGDVPSWRADAMPYGGVKDSGLGREGPAFAIEEMTERRLLVVRDPGTT